MHDFHDYALEMMWMSLDAVEARAARVALRRSVAMRSAHVSVDVARRSWLAALRSHDSR